MISMEEVKMSPRENPEESRLAGVSAMAMKSDRGSANVINSALSDWTCRLSTALQAADFNPGRGSLGPDY
jgi:hypothetical protein